MPFASWLRTLLSKSPSVQKMEESQADSDAVDNSVRMHIAANDPQFSAKREAAVETIMRAIDDVAHAHGFVKKKQSWAKQGALGSVSIHLQRSRYGFDCYVNLGFQPFDDTVKGPWAQDIFVPLSRFFAPNTRTPSIGAQNTGSIIYLDVHDDDTSLSPIMQILNDQALPWLLAHLTDPDAPIRPFLPPP